MIDDDNRSSVLHLKQLLENCVDVDGCTFESVDQAVEAAMVREIIDPIPATRVAGARPHLPGIVNVRGNVVPLADIRIRLGMQPSPNTADTRIVVMEIPIDGDPVVVGIIADKVHDVTEVLPADAQQTPRLGMPCRPEYVRFITRWNDGFIIVPDMERILN